MTILKKIFGTLDATKTEELDDGTIKVYGYASSEAVDSDGETITAEAMKAAIPDYMKFGAVREMHQPKAAGTAIEISVQDDGRTWFGAHVVDAEAVKKVKSGVYKGFSIGGKVTERDNLKKTVIKGLNLIEVSLVDRPANPEAVMTMYKADTLDDETAPTVESLQAELAKAHATIDELQAINKAGARFSAATKAALGTLHKAINDCSGHLDALGYQDAQEPDGDEAGKAATADALAKAQALFKSQEDALKAEILDLKNSADIHLQLVYDLDAACKAAGGEDGVKFADFIAKQADTLAKAQARIAELEAQPAPSKGMLKIIEKAQDILSEEKTEREKSQAVLQDPNADPVAKMKAIHAMGGQRLA